jgi:hypothetical protein
LLVAYIAVLAMHGHTIIKPMIRLGEVQCTHEKLELIAPCLEIISLLFNFMLFFKVMVTFYIKETLKFKCPSLSIKRPDSQTNDVFLMQNGLKSRYFVSIALKLCIKIGHQKPSGRPGGFQLHGTLQLQVYAGGISL